MPGIGPRAGTSPRQPCCNHLEAAFGTILPGISRGWTSVEAASAALEQVVADRVLLVIDDFHVLESTPAEQALERFVDYLPGSALAS